MGRVVHLFGKRYMFLYDENMNVYLGHVDDKGQEWEFENDKSAHHWFDCESVESDYTRAFKQFHRDDHRHIEVIWRRGYLARSLRLYGKSSASTVRQGASRDFLTTCARLEQDLRSAFSDRPDVGRFSSKPRFGRS